MTSDLTVSSLLESTGNILDKVLHYNLIVMDKHPITITNIVFGILLLVLGFKFARRLSKMLSSKLATVAHLEKSVTDALEKISYYILLVIITLTVLSISNVPLTAFTFIGGALAIGIGFGSQNIISNFISGLILIVERPIKVGDLVEVSTSLGRIVNIGARCTHLRTANSIDILVPNSFLLENTVINWTFSDNVVRANIVVSVSYTSSAKKVEQLLLSATQATPAILKTPEPQVFFISFAENILNFEVHFWMDLSATVEKRKIISDLNHLICASFAEHHIDFAFPKRDIHLTNGPLEVRIMDKDTKALKSV